MNVLRNLLILVFALLTSFPQANACGPRPPDPPKIPNSQVYFVTLENGMRVACAHSGGSILPGFTVVTENGGFAFESMASRIVAANRRLAELYKLSKKKAKKGQKSAALKKQIAAAQAEVQTLTALRDVAYAACMAAYR
jgi:hypothetical protein